MASFYATHEKNAPTSLLPRKIDPWAPAFTPSAMKPISFPSEIESITNGVSSLPSIFHPSQNSSRTLPVSRLRKTIVDKVSINRVTLISGETGSGKSSQVPQMLSDESLGPVLCTQPRRLAVVAVAKRVAEERGTLLGEDVGYHIGQKKLSNLRCRIVFATAGLLLEELRANGVRALAPYRTVILDEIHERSVESDLVLCCIKQLMLKHHTIRLVLMSATADFHRYADYFREFGHGEKVQRINIPSASYMLQHSLFSCRVKYLEHAVSELGKPASFVNLLETLKSSVSSDSFLSASIMKMNPTVHDLVLQLIIHIHANDANTANSIVVFLPTYRSLEQQWQLLQETRMPLSVYALHSSIDMDLCIRAMEAFHKNRKVILATSIAESSVTMPGMTYVIDLCRNVQIKWDSITHQHSARIVWSSVSQADQRKGRTGRTCNGFVYRLVPRALFIKFSPFEEPASCLLSLRRQALQLSSAESKAMFNPELLFSRCLDPPDASTVSAALEYLISIRALESNKNRSNRHPPTTLGLLLVNLPLSLDPALLVVRGGLRGLLYESVVLAAVIEATLKPIVQTFAQKAKYIQYLECYRQERTQEGYWRNDLDKDLTSYSSVLLANCQAFYFWQRSFKDEKRLQSISEYIHGFDSSSSSPFPSFPSYAPDSQEWEEEQEWCLQHHLMQSALHSVEEIVYSTFEVLHRFMPSFLSLCKGAPAYFDAPFSDHACHIVSQDSIATSGEGVKDDSSSYSFEQESDLEDEQEEEEKEEEEELEEEGEEEEEEETKKQKRFSIRNGNINGKDDVAMRKDEHSVGMGGEYQSDSTPLHPLHWNLLHEECVESPFVRTGSFTASSVDSMLKVMLVEARSDKTQIFQESEDGGGRGRGNETEVVLAEDPFSFELEPGMVESDLQNVIGGERSTLLSPFSSEKYSESEAGYSSDSFSKPSCIFFLQGKCYRGNACPFNHSIVQHNSQKKKNIVNGSGSDRNNIWEGKNTSMDATTSASMDSNANLNVKMTQCMFFYSAKGCRYGDGCKFLHSSASLSNSPHYSLPIEMPLEFPSFPFTSASSKASAESLFTMAGDPSKLILVIGEEDFVFSDSLLPLLASPSRLLSTSMKSADEILSLSSAADSHFYHLRDAGATVLFNVDGGVLSTSGGQIHAKDGEEDIREGVQERILAWNSLPWERIGRVIWTFPHFPECEGAESCARKLASFLSALCCPLLLRAPSECRVCITLKQEQFSRWHVLKASRECFLFLDEYLPFSPEQFSLKSDSMAKTGSMTYSFCLQKPSLRCMADHHLVAD